MWPVAVIRVNKVRVPYDSLHCAHKLLSSALPCVDGRGRRLVQMGLRRSPHLAAVVVDMATLAVADRPVAMAPTAAGREAGDHSPPNMRATVLQREEEISFKFYSWRRATKIKPVTSFTTNQPMMSSDTSLKINILPNLKATSLTVFFLYLDCICLSIFPCPYGVSGF